MKLIPFLSFDGATHEAMAFYAQALGGSVVSEMTYGEMPPSENMDGCGGMPAPRPEHVAHSQLEAGGAVLMAADGPAPQEPCHGTTINVEVDTVEQAERVFAALAEGGRIGVPLGETFWALRWGMLVDRYGKPWMVNCMKQP